MRIVESVVSQRAIIMLALATAFCTEPASASESTGSGAFSPQQFHIQAHRGAGIAAPENTLESFQMSWALGVVPEADLRTTRDNVIVCFHDPNLSRVVSNMDAAEKNLAIEELDAARVTTFEVGSFRGRKFAGQRVPLLSDVFTAMRGRPARLLYLDIKTVDLDALASLVRRYEVEPQVIFTSEEYSLIRRWKEKVPASLTLLWNRGTEEQLAARLQRLREAKFKDITHLQIHVHVGDLTSDEPFTPSSRFLSAVGQELKSHGIVFQVLPWKCADPRAYEKLLELGVASFATDYPEITVQAVRQFRRANLRE
jgi:glycerophosphoryl diester phosphodiesterase